VEIKELLFEKYIEWQKMSGGRRTITEWAKYLDVPQASLSNWMSGSYFPKGANLSKLADKLGPEVYDALGMTRPFDDNTPGFREWMNIYLEATPDERVNMLRAARSGDPIKVKR